MDFKKISARLGNSFIYAFFKWLIIAIIVGLVGGFIGSLFHISVEFATGFRTENSWLIYLLPLGGILIVFLYKITKASHKLGTNNVITAARTDGKVPFVLSPLIFISTFITHLLGGSAGREGAALQLGGSIGSFIGKIIRLSDKDKSIIVMCGMSGVFSALFGTPLTATVFAIEVISVGIIHYTALLPCLTSALTAYFISLFFGVEPVLFTLKAVPYLTFNNILKTIILGILCAAVSILFCLSMKGAHKLYSKYLKNLYIRAFVGGIIIIALTFFVGSYDYNGAGMNIIEKALFGQANSDAFLWKIIFTAITIGAGYKGGEIVPTFFIGSTFGCTMGIILNFDGGFCGALGLIGLFCGVVNCPLASLILSVELFGDKGIIFFAIVVSVSYMLSGYHGLYSSQQIVYSKLKEEYININAK